EELEGFSQRAAYAGYLNTYSFFQELRSRIRENQGLIVGSTALDLVTDVTIRDVFIVFGKDGATEYEKGKAMGRLVGTALSLIGYATTYYRFLSEGPKLLSLGGKIRAFLRGVYNWITPPLWDVGVIAGKLTARAVAASLAISEGSDDFKQRLNEIKDDEGSLSSLVEFTGRFLDDALDVSSKLELSEEAFFGLLWAYGKCELSEGTWGKFIQEVERIGGKSKRCADELLRSIFNAEGAEVEYAVLKLAPRLAELSSEEIGCLEKFLAAGVGMKKIGSILERLGELTELLTGIKSFDFQAKPRRITLKKGESSCMKIGKDSKLEAGTYIVKVCWEYGEKSGVAEFPITRTVESDQIIIQEHVVDQILEEIGSDDAEVSITKAEFFDYKFFFPTEFSAGGKRIEVDLFYNEMTIDRRNYRFEPHTDIWRGRLRVDAEFEGKNIEGKNLLLSFYKDGEVRIRYGEDSFLIKEISADTSIELMTIKYRDNVAEYSFNLKHLDEQTGRLFYEIPVKEGQTHVWLKERLFRLFGYDAFEELREGIGSKYGIIVGYDNGKKAYCGTKGFGASIPKGASKVEWIKVITIEGRIPQLLHEIIEAKDLSDMGPKIGEAGERIVVFGYEGINYLRGLLATFSEKTEIPLSVLEGKNSMNEDVVKFEYLKEGKSGEESSGRSKPDALMIANDDIVVNGKVAFKKGEVMAIIEVKSSVSEESPDDLCEVAMSEKGLERYVDIEEYKNVKYGIAIGFSYDPEDILVGEPGRIKIEVVELCELRK
ncbi:MAG: hypothetical protein FGF48_07725, partial [Candidatus Brockarchaeota archaeon]|nr:hypothetical protein [Candidatus Brockarchaeota archaeon]